MNPKGETIYPGELLGTGTVGLGCGLELEVEGIGILRNRIGQPEPRGWEPERRAASA